MIVKVDAPSGRRVPILDWTSLSLNHAALVIEAPMRATTRADQGGDVSTFYLLASSSDAVYAWKYTCDDTKIDVERHQVLVRDINRGSPSKFNHQTRSLSFDPESGYLYVSIGSVGNVDADSRAARIKRFNIFDDSLSAHTNSSRLRKSKKHRSNKVFQIQRRNVEDSDDEGENDRPELPVPEGGFDFVSDGELFADGLRNSIAQAWDSRGRLWEANNGPDNLAREDLHDYSQKSQGATAKDDPLGTPVPKDFHNDSPVEEINLLDEQGRFYGYPYCFTSGNVTLSFDDDPIRGVQWAWQKGGLDGIHDDAWCRNVSNNKPPSAHLPAHTAPIAMTFLKEEDGCGKIKNVSFPCSLTGNLIVTLHGSWNRDIPQGYSVVMIPFEKGLPKPSQAGQFNSFVTLLKARDLQNKCTNANAGTCFRPTGVAVSKERGTLLVASDTTGELVEILFSNWTG
ncbi:hypothetical protein BC830DRAFT_383091 [Chytriomyces sp. MP71]|nr:hypothetical protein BC830DRAFT_383091 [Chytriomyces sp. MP71]